MSKSFDELTRALGQSLTRRQALGRFAAYLGGAVASLFCFTRRAHGVDAYTCNRVCRVFPTAAERNRCLQVCLACPSVAQLCGSTAANLTCYPASALTNAVGLSPVGGVCVPVCQAGFANCDGNTLTGCETNVANNVNHCGSCANACGFYANASTSCVNGTCQAICLSGYQNCDGNIFNGCETNVTNNVNNCGGCGVRCAAGQSCSGGRCV